MPRVIEMIGTRASLDPKTVKVETEDLLLVKINDQAYENEMS
jgi:hypothetical protein